MFRRFRQRLRDMRTISQLCSGAEAHALRGGEQAPGAEHFLLAARDLPEGSARRVFERLQADAGAVDAAIARQYTEALRHVGVDAARLEAVAGGPAPLPPKGLPFPSKASAQALMQGLVAQRALDKDVPLLGAHVLAVIAGMQHGVAARSLQGMGVALPALGAAAKAEIEAAASAG